jgi:hypothetical protein
MNKKTLSLGLIASVLALAFSLTINSAEAQATRTWVSGVGDDANPCSRTAPCKTFAGAISKTAAAGEINVLDPGGYGAVTITKSISIYNDGVGEAGVLVSGTNGIVIAAGPADVVNLRGLVINGLNSSLNGIQIQSAWRVNIQNCVIQEFGNGGSGLAGINIAPTANVAVKVQDSTVISNSAGIIIKTAGGTAYVDLDRTRIDNNRASDGVRVDGSAGGLAVVSIADGSMSFNAGNGLVTASGPGVTLVSLMRNVFSANGSFGVASAGGASAVTVGSSLISYNGSGGVGFSGGGVLQSFGTNQVNGGPGTGFSGFVALQ